MGVGIGPDVEGFTIGQRVGIGVQRSNCGDCECCNNGAEQLCGKIHKTYAGPGKDKGGFAVHIRYTAKWTFAVPDSIPSDAAAPLLCAGITTFSPIKRHCKVGQKVGVIGIGGLGHLALQIASAMGCEVYAISRSEAKKEEALGFGATGFIASAIPEQFNAAKGSLDVIINTVSAVTGMDEYLSLLKPRGVMAYLESQRKTRRTRLRCLCTQSCPRRRQWLVATWDLTMTTLRCSHFAPNTTFGLRLSVCHWRKRMLRSRKCGITLPAIGWCSSCQKPSEGHVLDTDGSEF